MRVWMSERPSRGAESEGESSTRASACSEALKSLQDSARALRCNTTVSVDLRSALSWTSNASR